MSKLKTKLKAKLKPTYEKAEVKPLTRIELDKLSRETILEMYRKQRWGKLKALQEEITDKTSDEKGDLREVIIENAKKRLNDLEKTKRLRFSKEDQLAEARSFADALTGIDDEEGAIMKVLKHQQHKQKEFELFIKTMDNFCGREKRSKRLKKLIKNNAYVAKLMLLIQQKNPKAMDDINLAINQGDYEKLKKAMVKADTGISEKQVDYVFAAALTGTTGKKEYIGNKTIDGLLNHVASLRYIGHTYSMKKAAKAADVSFWFVMRLGQTTLASLKSMDDRLQSHKALLENKKKLTKRDQQRLDFIAAVSKMRKTYEVKVGEKGLEDTFKDHLEQHLEKKFNDPKFQKRVGDVDKERLKAEIMANAQLDQLKLYQIFDLTYGSDEERSRLLFHGLTRGGAIGYQYYKNLYLEEDRHLRRAFVDYFVRRGANREIRAFRKNAKKWGLNELVKDLDDLETRAKKTGAPLGDLADDAQRYEIDRQGTQITGKELYDRDMIVKKYHILAKRATEIMSAEARPTIYAGKVIEKIKHSKGAGFMAETVDNMNIKTPTLEAIYGKGKIPSDLSKVTGEMLVGAYGNKLVDLKTMQDVTRARFSGLAHSIESNVESSFSKKMTGQLKDIEEAKFRNRVEGKLENIETTSKVKKYGKRLIIPAIIVGVQAGRLWTGNAKTGEAFWDITEAGLGFVPVVGTLLDFNAARTGRSLSGKKLNLKERGISFAFGCIGGIADVLTVVGGTGLALRATVGGMRGTRRALQAGKTMGNLSDAGHLAGKGPLTKLGGWFGGKFNKASRLEDATTATIKGKATQQARYVSDINHEIKGMHGVDAIDTTKPLNSEISRIEREISGMPNGAAKAKITGRLDDLRDMQKGVDSDSSYIAAFQKAAGREMTAVTKSDWWIVRQFQSASMFTIEAFRRARAGLKRLGVSKTAIAEYEKSFKAIKTLRQTRLDKMEDMAKLVRNKNIAEKEWRALEAMKDTLSKDKKALIEKLAEERKLIAKQRKLKLEKETVKREQKALLVENKVLRKDVDPIKMYHDLKGSFKTKMSYKKFAELVEKRDLIRHISGVKNQNKALKLVTAQQKTGVVTKLKANMASISKKKPDFKKADDALKSQDNLVTAKQGEIGTLDTKLTKADKEFRDRAIESSNIIKNSENQMAIAKTDLSDINRQLNTKAAEQFRIHSEMALKAERWTQRTDNMRKLSKMLQIGGMGMGAVWFLSDWKTDPIDQAKFVGKGVKYAGKAVGAVGHELYFADHSGKGSIDQYIENKVHALEQKKKMDGILARAKAEGRSEVEVLAENSNTVGAQEIIRKNGLAGKIAALKAKASSGTLRREIVSGDAAKKAGEKLAG